MFAWFIHGSFLNLKSLFPGLAKTQTSAKMTPLIIS